MPSVEPTIVGEAPTEVVFARSNDPIKKLPDLNFDSGQDLTVAGWLEAAFYPFIPAALAFEAMPTQEFGLTTNTKTLEGDLTVWDEDTFTASSFILRKNTLAQGSAFATPTGDTDWSRSVNLQPDDPSDSADRTASYTIEIRFGDSNTLLLQDRDVTFAPPTYHAQGTAAMTPAQIQDPANGEKHAINSNNSEHTYIAPNGKYVHVAVPVEFGKLTSVKDINLYPQNDDIKFVDSNGNLFDFDVASPPTRSFTLGSHTVSYYVYRYVSQFVGSGNFYLSFT